MTDDRDAAPPTAGPFTPPPPFRAPLDSDCVLAGLLLELALSYADERRISLADSCRVAARLLSERAKLLERIAAQGVTAP